ncbi:hypothetical protein TNCV_552161 [Trichonephila clavipes]|nr:hypothetical protein TNCV_552161 [Trichonephila clavipes]
MTLFAVTADCQFMYRRLQMSIPQLFGTSPDTSSPFWNPSGQGIGSWLGCHKFEPSTTKDPPCRGAVHVKTSRAITSFRWCGVVFRRGGCHLMCHPNQVSLNQGSKLRSPSPKSLV